MIAAWPEFEKPLDARLKPYDARRAMKFWEWVSHWLYLDQVNAANPTRRTAAACGVMSYGFARNLRVGASLLTLGVLVISMVIVERFSPEDIVTLPDGFMTGIGLWGLIITVCRFASIRNAAGTYAEYQTLWMLPLTLDRIFESLTSSVVFGLFCLFFEFLSAYGLIAFAYRPSLSNFVICVPCAALQAAFSMGVTLLLLRLNMRAQWLVLPALLLGLASVFGASPDTSHLLPPSIVSALRLSNPMDWVNACYLNGWIRGDMQAWWCLVAVVAILAALPNSLRACRRMHHQGAFRKPAVYGARAISEALQKTPPPSSDPAEVRREILSANFLHPLPWNDRGPLERLLSRILRRNEMVIARSLVISPPAWIKRFFIFIICLLCFWLTNTLIDFRRLEELAHQSKWSFPEALTVMLLSLTLVALTVGYAAALFSWSAFPSLRLLPMRSFELWKIAAKVNALILAPIFLPLAILYPFSPVRFPILISGGTDIGFLARVITVIACCSFTGAWCMTIYRLGRLKRWLSLIVVSVGTFLPGYVGLLWVIAAPKLQSKPVLAPLLILAPVGWSYLCATLELGAWRRAAQVCNRP